jgi:anti-sigma-K factor RskA
MQDGAHQPYEDDLAAYLLDALPEPEARAFEAHLEACELCQARERWLRTSVEVLPSSVEQVEPPPELRKRLLDTVQSEAGAPAPAPARRPERRRGSRRWLGSFVLTPVTAAAAAVLILVAGVAGYLLRGDESGPPTSTVAAKSTPAAPGVKATILRTGDRGILRVEGLPQRKGRVYEIWLMRGGRPEPSTLFQVRRDGRGAAAIPRGLDDATQVLVTSEPLAGSDKPTTKPILSARV